MEQFVSQDLWRSYHLDPQSSQYLPEARSQIGETCVQNATSAVMEFKLRRRLNFLTPISVSTTHMCDLWGGPIPELDIMSFLEWLKNHGVCSSQTYRGSLDSSLTEISYPNYCKVSNIRWIHRDIHNSENVLCPLTDPDCIINELENGPLVIAVRGCRKLGDLREDDVYVWEQECGEDGEAKLVRYHAMCCLGYGYCKRGAFFFVLNSYGRNWCNQGIGKVLWSEVFAAWAIDI